MWRGSWDDIGRDVCQQSDGFHGGVALAPHSAPFRPLSFGGGGNGHLPI